MQTKVKILIGVLLLAVIVAVALPIIRPTYLCVLTHESIIKANLRQFTIASFLYMDEYDVNSVAYSDLFGPGKLSEQSLRPCSGEDYNDLTITDTDTVISIKTHIGKDISLEIESYKDVA